MKQCGDESAGVPVLLSAMASNPAQPVKLKDLDLPYLSPVSAQLLKSIACHRSYAAFCCRLCCLFTVEVYSLSKACRSILSAIAQFVVIVTGRFFSCQGNAIAGGAEGFLPGSDGSLATSWRLPSLTHLSIHYLPISEVPFLLQADLPSLSCCVLMVYPDTDDNTFFSPQDVTRLKKQLRALRTLGVEFKLGRPGQWQWRMARGSQKLELGGSLETLVCRQQEVRDTFSGCPEPVALVGTLEGEEALLSEMGLGSKEMCEGPTCFSSRLGKGQKSAMRSSLRRPRLHGVCAGPRHAGSQECDGKKQNERQEMISDVLIN
eukprot:1158287-Pelagomonas_calceolata.AAC.1